MREDQQNPDGSGGSLQDYMGTFFGGDGSGGVSTAPTQARTTDPSADPGRTSPIPQPQLGPAVIPGPGAPPPPSGQGFGWNNYQNDPHSGFLAALNSGLTGEDLVNQANSAYGLGYGSGFAYYPNKNVYATPGGGYFAQGPNGQWGWNVGDSAGGGPSVSSGLQGNGGTSFNDPAYQQLASLAQQAIGKLGQPVSFPQLDQYMQMLQQNETQQQQYAKTFADQLTQRVGQLQQPLLSDANVANQRALASNNLLAQRDNALANMRQRQYANGFAPTSGLIDYDTNQINQQYGNQQANIDAQLQANSIAQDEARRNEATQLQGLTAQALAGGNVAALQSQAQSADLENQLYNLNNQRMLEALQVGQVPVDLTNQGFSNALNASNISTNPLTGILSLLALGNQQQGLQQQGQNSNQNALAWLLQQALG